MADQQAQTSRQESTSETGVLTQAKDLASNIAGQATHEVRQRVERQTSKSASDLSDLAQAIRLMTKQLSSNVTAPFLNKSADRIEAFSQLLSEPDLSRLARNVEGYARQNPLLFLGGAIAFGLAGGRLLSGTIAGQDGKKSVEVETQGSSAKSRRARESNPSTSQERG
jgi:hypothetical protein